MGYFKTLFVKALDGHVAHESTPSVKEMLAVALDGGKDTLEEHDRKYHPEGYKEGDECKYRENEKAKDRVDDLSEHAEMSENGGNREVTPEEDAAYMEAVKRGDVETAQKMVFATAKKYYGDSLIADHAGNPVVFYHGSKDKHNVFDPRKDKNGFGDVYFTDNPEYARRFGDEVQSVILVAENPSEHDFSKEGFSNAVMSRYSGHDAAFVYGVMDFTGIKHGEVLMRKMENIKSADPVTYDDQGNIIPLSRRFDGGDDIRGDVTSKQDKDTLKEHAKDGVDDLGDKGGTNGNGEVTPAEDAAYMDAVKRGDMETAAKMVREVAGRAFPNTKVVDDDGLPKAVWHGSPNNFTSFENSSGTSLDNVHGIGHWFSPDKMFAKKFLERRRRKKRGNLMSVFLNIENPRTYTNLTPEPTALEDSMGQFKADVIVNSGGYVFTTADLYSSRIPPNDVIKVRQQWQQEGFDGVITKDSTFDMDCGGGTQICIFNNKGIKSADPVTYDDNGNVIPLSRRFDDGDDIRGDITSNLEGDEMEKTGDINPQGEAHETALEKMVEGMGINVYRPAIAETLKEMAGEVPDAVITSTEEFDREVKGMKEGKRTYMDVRNAYAKLKDACGDLDWTKAIVKMAAKITKACAKQDIEEDVK